MGPRHAAQELLESLKGAVGQEVIQEKFCQLHAALYNSAGTEWQMEKLKRHVQVQLMVA